MTGPNKRAAWQSLVPRRDKTGLHAGDCECVRCSLGFRPTNSQRWAAERALARARAKKASDAAADAAATRKAAAAADVIERAKRARMETTEYADKLAAEAAHGMTAEEHEAMRKEIERFKLGRKK
jgi:hypothetical protein